MGPHKGATGPGAWGTVWARSGLMRGSRGPLKVFFGPALDLSFCLHARRLAILAGCPVGASPSPCPARGLPTYSGSALWWPYPATSRRHCCSPPCCTPPPHAIRQSSSPPSYSPIERAFRELGGQELLRTGRRRRPSVQGTQRKARDCVNSGWHPSHINSPIHTHPTNPPSQPWSHTSA